MKDNKYDKITLKQNSNDMKHCYTISVIIAPKILLFSPTTSIQLLVEHLTSTRIIIYPTLPKYY